MADYFLTRLRTGLSAQEARDAAAGAMPAVARPYDKADWCVAYLSRTAVPPGEEPFQLTRAEKAALAEWAKTTHYVNLTHFAAERKGEIERYMLNLLDSLNDAESPSNREGYKKLLDDAVVKWAAWSHARGTI